MQLRVNVSVLFFYIWSCAVQCLNDWMLKHDVRAEERLETAVCNDIERLLLRNKALI